MEYFLYYQYAITAFLALILLNFIVNNIVYKNVSKFILPSQVLKNGPLVSVLIPARNEKKSIGRCLRSLSKQDYHNLEILVLDDNSSDGTGRVVEEISKKDTRIRLIRGCSLDRGGRVNPMHVINYPGKQPVSTMFSQMQIHYIFQIPYHLHSEL